MTQFKEMLKICLEQKLFVKVFHDKAFNFAKAQNMIKMT